MDASQLVNSENLGLHQDMKVAANEVIVVVSMQGLLGDGHDDWQDVNGSREGSL